jgi:HAMP domain-containing protein
MKKLSYIAITGVLLIAPALALAEGPRADIKNGREDGRALLEQKKSDIKLKIEVAKEKARTKYGEAVQRSVGNIVDQLSKHVTDLTNIATRIDTRITELQGNGKDMSTSISLLATARTAIATAQDKVSAVGTTLAAMLSNTNPKSQFQSVRDAVKAAEGAIKTAKQSLQKALESVKTAATN